ncbi:CDP-alcohol phosphatidyltransferase family protein [Herbiconiux liukaitaii]|uniref:CDP-alcohol phosphatidyltransferase family protein n=1 Tax=Herbiconiux liukaitaii TaxID=3342799 RepID=UPI0035BB8D29
MNIPNSISLGRLIVLTPLFVVVLLVWESPFWALMVLVVLGVTDWADGFIARRFDLITDLGKKLDPIADRVSQFVVCVTLVVAGIVPLWMAVVLLVADLLLGVTALVTKPGIVPVRWMGRLRTVLLMVGFPLLLLIEWLAPGDAGLELFGLVVVGVGVVLHALANVEYTVRLIVGRRRVDTEASVLAARQRG